MQDIHSIGTGNGGGDVTGGGGGRLFGGIGGSNGGDRRLRPHNHHHHHHTPLAMKCPRCESLNTKFCYYNNYNLSQPRHFCKSCRRYWTKGGVLRNVPVGGGCRKTKRSKSKTNSSSHSGVRKSTNSQNSSSDSSSLTEKTTKTTNPVFNFHEKTTPTTTGFVNIANSGNLVPQNPSFNPPFSSENNNNNALFPEIGSFTNLITSSSASQISQISEISEIPLGFHDILQFRSPNETEIGEELKDEIPMLGGFTEDWNNGTDEALFDLTGAVDQSYWNHGEWNDHDQGDEHQLNYLR